MAAQEWIIGDGATAIGPLSTVQLKALVAAGKVTMETLVRTTTMATPVPARRVQGLFPGAPGTAAITRAPTAPMPALPQPPTEMRPRSQAPAAPTTGTFHAATLETIDLPPVPVAQPPPLAAEPVLRNGLGIPVGESLFKEDPPAAPRPERQPTARLSGPAAGTARLGGPGNLMPPPRAATPVPPPPNALPLQAPRWQDLWPLAAVMLVLGWIIGSWGVPGRFFVPDSFGSVLVLALAAVPLSLAAFMYWLRPRQVPIGRSLAIGAFTGIGGVLALLALQFCASHVAFGRIRFYGKAGLILLVLAAIGWAYSLTDASNIALRWFGYVFGVGLCEETVKLLPLIWLLRGDTHMRMGLHTFMVLGFASGLGFGITEGLYFYNPWHGSAIHGSQMSEAGDNLIRWFALVPSHGLWTAMCAGFLWKRQARLAGADGFWEQAFEVAKAAGAMALVHGTYDTLCSLGPVVAIIFDAATFLGVVWLTRRFTAEETDPASAAQAAGSPITQRLPVLGAWLGAAVLLAVLALAGTVDQPHFDQHMARIKLAELRAEYPELRPYFDQVKVLPSEGAAEAVQSVFAVDAKHPEHGIVGTLRNVGSEPLRHVTFTCIDVQGEEQSYERESIAAGGEALIDPETEWTFAPREQVTVTWEGHEEPLHFTLP